MAPNMPTVSATAFQANALTVDDLRTGEEPACGLLLPRQGIKVDWHSMHVREQNRVTMIESAEIVTK